MADTLPLKLLLFVCLFNHIQGEWAAPLADSPPIYNRAGSRKAASLLASRADQQGLLVVKTAPFCGITPSYPPIIPQKLSRLDAVGWITPMMLKKRLVVSSCLLSCLHRCSCYRLNSGDSHCCGRTADFACVNGPLASCYRGSR